MDEEEGGLRRGPAFSVPPPEGVGEMLKEDKFDDKPASQECCLGRELGPKDEPSRARLLELESVLDLDSALRTVTTDLRSKSMDDFLLFSVPHPPPELREMRLSTEIGFLRRGRGGGAFPSGSLINPNKYSSSKLLDRVPPFEGS